MNWQAVFMSQRRPMNYIWEFWVKRQSQSYAVVWQIIWRRSLQAIWRVAV
jgi:hypothetical protein